MRSSGSNVSWSNSVRLSSYAAGGARRGSGGPGDTVERALLGSGRAQRTARMRRARRRHGAEPGRRMEEAPTLLLLLLSNRPAHTL